VNELTKKQSKQLRKIGHQLKPIVTVAQKGLTENVISELERALTDHELIKVKIVAGDRIENGNIINEIELKLSTCCVQKVGHIALLYRPSNNSNPKLSNLLRIPEDQRRKIRD